MIEVEYRTECAFCHRVIKRIFKDMPDDYKGRKIIPINDICQRCKNNNRTNLEDLRIGILNSILSR
jgi:hypothetical protein